MIFTVRIGAEVPLAMPVHFDNKVIGTCLKCEPDPAHPGYYLVEVGVTQGMVPIFVDKTLDVSFSIEPGEEK